MFCNTGVAKARKEGCVARTNPRGESVDDTAILLSTWDLREIVAEIDDDKSSVGVDRRDGSNEAGLGLEYSTALVLLPSEVRSAARSQKLRCVSTLALYQGKRRCKMRRGYVR